MSRLDRSTDTVQPLDPVTLSLAIWVGVTAAVTGLQYIAAQVQAPARAALPQDLSPAAAVLA